MQVRSLCQEDPLEEGMATHSVFLPGGSNGQRRLVGYIHRVAELDTTEVAQCTPHTHTHTHTHTCFQVSLEELPCRSHLGTCHHQLETFLKPPPGPAFLIQALWHEAQEAACEEVPWCCCC